MNRASTLALAILCVFAFTVAAPAFAQEASPTEWSVPGTALKAPAKKKKGKGGGGAARVQLKANPNLVAAISKTSTNLVIRLSDGKQKFGSPTIRIKNGENTYLRPRLSVTVPLASAAAVTQNTPLKVIAFSHLEDEFEINLVANPNSELPDVVFTKK